MRGEMTSTLLSEFICEQLHKEIQQATGCTEVAAAALAVAKAVETLGSSPKKVELIVSPNVYKNGAFAGVPGMKAPGFLSAMALGATIGQTKDGLNLLADVGDEILHRAETFRATAQMAVKFERTPSPLHFYAIAYAENSIATATISGSHSHFTEVTRNNDIVLSDTPDSQGQGDRPRICSIPVRDLLQAVNSIPLSELEFLYQGAEMNALVRNNHLGKSNCSLAAVLHRKAIHSPTPTHMAQAFAGGASEARMTGSTDPVMAITGSGNHGITNFLGLYGVAQSINATHEQTLRALAISSLVTVIIKAHTGRLTAFCGCSIAPATGIAAATVYLNGGSVEVMEHAMQSVIGTFAGMLCDGAKTSCAYKVSTVVGGAIDMAYMALEGAYIPDGDGILGETIDVSIENLAQLNNPGMQVTETTVLAML